MAARKKKHYHNKLHAIFTPWFERLLKDVQVFGPVCVV